MSGVTPQPLQSGFAPSAPVAAPAAGVTPPSGQPPAPPVTTPGPADATHAAPRPGGPAPVAPGASFPGAAAPTTPAAAPATAPALPFPPRRADAETGEAFLARISHLPQAQQEEAIYQAIDSGNVPSFLRHFEPVTTSFRGADGQRHTLTFNALPNYLAIGSDTNYRLVPMTPMLAQRIATRMGARLPSPRMVDAIYQAAPNRLAPQPESERNSASIERHNQRVQRQMGERGFDPQRLTAGHQKDVILSHSVTIPAGRVGIYGWHQPNGQPIQPFSTVHDAHYMDYSHGVRLISPSFSIDGQPATEWPQGFAP